MRPYDSLFVSMIFRPKVTWLPALCAPNLFSLSFSVFIKPESIKMFFSFFAPFRTEVSFSFLYFPFLLLFATRERPPVSCRRLRQLFYLSLIFFL